MLHSALVQLMLNPGLAQEILDTDDARLEANTRKLKHHCHDELTITASTGCLKLSGLLRSVLLSAALMLRLDIQELESLNSMTKMAMLRANTTTMTLELLCSRVCLRKIIATMSGNSTRFKDVAPIAASVARSCFLHWTHRAEVQDNPERFAASVDAAAIANGHPRHWNPALLPTAEHKWAMSSHKKIMQALKNHLYKSVGFQQMSSIQMYIFISRKYQIWC